MVQHSMSQQPIGPDVWVEQLANKRRSNKHPGNTSIWDGLEWHQYHFLVVKFAKQAQSLISYKAVCVILLEWQSAILGVTFFPRPFYQWMLSIQKLPIG